MKLLQLAVCIAVLTSTSAVVPPDNIAPCPAEMSLTGSSCIAINSRADNTARSLNFDGGLYNCEHVYHLDAHYPHINSLEENNVFVAKRDEYQNAAAVPLEGAEGEIWLNMKYHTSLSKWKWQDDSTDLTWSNWEGDSVPTNTYEGCAVIQKDGTWALRDCAKWSSMIICQLDAYRHYCADGCNAGECVYTGTNTDFKCACPLHVFGATCSDTCGGTAEFSKPYTFTTPNYPSDASCTWVLPWMEALPIFLVPAVTLEGTIEDTANCEHDYVKLYEGATLTDATVSDQRLLRTLCGDVTGTYNGTPGKSLIVVFKSNSAIEFPFSISKFDVTYVV